MAKHAKLSPSSGKRWINCAGSVALIGTDKSLAGEAAMRGTAAHKIIEVMIQNGETEARDYHGRSILVHVPGTLETIILDAGAEIPKAMMTSAWRLFVADDLMTDGVQTAIDECERIIGTMYAPEVFTERYLDMTWLDPALGGTADWTAVEPFGWAHLLDYKNGWVTVDHKDNDQTKIYAVGILHEHPDAEGVRVTICQPNAIHEEGGIRTVEYTRDELKLYEIQLKAACRATRSPDAPRVAGDWCMWCPAKLRCKEHDDFVQAEAQMEFADDPDDNMQLPMVLADTSVEDNGDEWRATLAQKAKWIPIFNRLISDLKGAILAELMGGNVVPGFKLVRGKSNRAWVLADDRETAQIFSGMGLNEDDLFGEPKLRSPAQIEKMGSGKEQRKAIKRKVAELCFKPEGKLTVAEDSDPRESVDPLMIAAGEFADDPEDENPWE